MTEAKRTSSISDAPERPCQHTKVLWGKLQMDYQGDGSAIVWQNGACSDCEQRLVAEYIQQTPKAA